MRQPAATTQTHKISRDRPHNIKPVLRSFFRNFEVHAQTFCNVGDNDFAAEHTGVRKRQREGILEKVVKYDGRLSKGVRLDGIESQRRRGRLVGIFPPTLTDAVSPR